MQTLQQQRAKHAMEQVKALIPLNDGKKLTSRASELPFMIHTNGLGQALAFFKSKQNKDGYDKLYLLLQNWLTGAGRPFQGKPDLMAAITEADLQTYCVAQAESIAYMDWVKKFASAYLKE